MTFSNSTIFFFGLLLLISTGCNSRHTDKNVEIINIGDSEPQYLSKIIDEIEYVVLENSNMPFVQADKLFVFEGGIILADFWSNHTLLRYDHYGNFLNSFGRYGEGPGEYGQITDVDFDETNNNLIVISRNHLITYGQEGNYINELPLKNRPTNFLKIEGNNYLFYFPEVLAPELRKGIDNAIIYKYITETETLEPILNPIYPERLNYIGDKNILSKMGNNKLFSTSLCDTIYLMSESRVEKKFFLDFGSEQNDLSKLYNLSLTDLLERLNSDEFNNIATHWPHLFGNNHYLSSAFSKKTGVYFFVYDLKEKISYVSSKTLNDVDGGLGFGIIKRMDENYFYSFFEPEEILQHYEKNKEELDKLDNNFTKLARQISRDDFLILAKYKLKK